MVQKEGRTIEIVRKAGSSDYGPRIGPANLRAQPRGRSDSGDGKEGGNETSLEKKERDHEHESRFLEINSYVCADKINIRPVKTSDTPAKPRLTTAVLTPELFWKITPRHQGVSSYDGRMSLHVNGRRHFVPVDSLIDGNV